jgi:hypothetical protein
VMFGRFEILCVRWWNLLHSALNSCNTRIGAKLMVVLRKRGRNIRGSLHVPSRWKSLVQIHA